MTLWDRLQEIDHRLALAKPNGALLHQIANVRTMIQGALVKYEKGLLDPDEEPHCVRELYQRAQALLNHQMMREAAQDLEEFAFGAAWDKLKELGKIAKDNFMQGYRRGRGLPEPKAKAAGKSKVKAKPKPKAEPKAEPKQQAEPTKKKAPKRAPKADRKPAPGLDKRKTARKGRKAAKAAPKPTPKAQAKPKAKTPTKGKPAAGSKTKAGKVKPGTVQKAPNAPDKVRVMGKDGKWSYYDKQEYAKLKRGKR